MILQKQTNNSKKKNDCKLFRIDKAWWICAIYTYEDIVVSIMLKMQKEWWKLQNVIDLEDSPLQVFLLQDFEVALYYHKIDKDYEEQQRIERVAHEMRRKNSIVFNN